MDLVECLMRVGLTKHESLLYLALCKEGTLTGYEAAKSSGIPRSNAYLALSGLVEKGGAYRVDADNVVKYTFVPPDELARNLRHQLEENLEYLISNAPLPEVPVAPFITIVGREHILNKMRNIIAGARKRMYFSGAFSEVELISSELRKARERGLKVVLITNLPLMIEGIIIHHADKEVGEIRLIADSSDVLTGEIGDVEGGTCLYSQNKNLVQLIKDSLKNEIKLIELMTKKSGGTENEG